MTIALEQLADDSAADRNFQKLQTLVPDTGGQSVGIRVGTIAVTFTASKVSATATVTHGLGTTPVNVQLTPTGGGAVPVSAMIISGSLNSTTFQVRGSTADGTAITSSITLHWLAVG